MRHRLMTLTMGAAALLTACGEADPVPMAETRDADIGANAAAAGASDGTLLTLGGEVVATGPNWFTLGVGQEEVIVEMDDWDWFREGQALKVGDEVSVTGRVDNDLLEQSKLEARSVYVRDLGVTFFASGIDEEDFVSGLMTANSTTSAQGFVSQVEGQEFTIGGITGPIRVDGSQVESKPTIKVGDRVYAWGEIDIEPRERTEIMAERIILLSPDRSKKASVGKKPSDDAPNVQGPAADNATGDR